MKSTIKLMVILLTILLVISAIEAMAVEINKEKSRIMLEQGDKALVEKDFTSAKLYYKQAIQYDPFNKIAMDKYENLIRITSTNANIDLSVFGNIKANKKDTTKSEPIKTETKQPAAAPKLEFQGC